MSGDERAELVWVAMIVGGHVIAVVLLLRDMLSAEDRRSWRAWWRDDEDGGGGWDGPDPVPPGPQDGGDRFPLLDRSRPARARMRSGERLADLVDGPLRRGANDPVHRPAPERRPVSR